MKRKIKYKNIVLPTIKALRLLAYKKVFEGLNYFEEKRLDRGLNLYPKADLTIREMDELISINKIMLKWEQGGFGEMKEKVEELKLDYRSIYGLS